MKNILKAIRAGAFKEEGHIPDSMEYKKAVRRQIACYENLAPHLGQKAKELFEEYKIATFKVQEELEMEKFRQGFLLGIGIQKEIDKWMCDCEEDDDE